MKITFDTLATMNDEDLYGLGRKTKAQINEIAAKRSGKTRGDHTRLSYLQTDLCYIQREIKIRKERSDAHSRWVQSQRK